MANSKEKIIITMKDILLINNGVFLETWAKVMDTINYLYNCL